MSTQIVRVQGYSKGSLTCIGNECDRTPGIEHRNSDIVPERSALNYSYKDVAEGGSFYSEHADIIGSLNAKYTEKKSGIAFEGMLITADSEFFEKLGYDVTKNAKPPKAVKEFFDKSYKWALEQVGYKGTEKNIISAKIHYDEKTPHLHIYYVPITDKWQEKVYQKDENGKVQRNEKGSPLQAKDENGKTIYKQVENSQQPKLSRTEFWRVRGGKNSYRRMQDDFQEKIGKEYGLERGEVGSTREHETKYQHKEKELKKSLASYTELRIRTDKVNETGKEIPLTGQTMIKTSELKKIKQQAKAYTVNRDGFKTLKSDQESVRQAQEQLKKEQEQLEKERAALSSERQRVNAAYQRQLDINRVLEQTERELKSEKEKNGSLVNENASLSRSNARQIETIQQLEKANRGAYESLTSVVKAVGMLKYDKEDGYRAELTEKQERLIDAVAKYGARWAREDGFPDLAKEMDEHIGISKGIQEDIQELTPKRSRGRGGMSL